MVGPRSFLVSLALLTALLKDASLPKESLCLTLVGCTHSQVAMGILCLARSLLLRQSSSLLTRWSWSRRHFAKRDVSDFGAIDAQAEIARLADEILLHDQLYYRDSAPEISDEEYDLLVQYAADLEGRFPQFVPPHSRSRRVGYRHQLTVAEGGFEPVRHRSRMYSLDNAFKAEDIEAFLQRLRRVLPPTPPEQESWDLSFVGEPKIDGVSLSLAYRDGILLHAATRGDGITGELVTANALRIKGVPAEIKSGSPFLEVRGEVFCPLEEFRSWSLALEGQEPKSPRNVAAGSVRQQDARITAERPLMFCAYAVEFENGKGPESHGAALDTLSSWGFRTSLDLLEALRATMPETQLTSVEDMVNFAEWMQEHREIYDFPCDGVVFKLDDLKLAKLAGFTARAPRSAIAFKFASSKFSTVLLDVEVGVGRTGLLTPRAVLEPVHIDGVNVSKATLHNFKLLETLDLQIGDLLAIERAGDVIPRIIGKLSSANMNRRKITAPTECPSCGSPIQVEESGKQLRCTNSFLRCPSQTIEYLYYANGREVLDIPGFGRKKIEALYEAGYLQTPVDILDLPELEATRLRNHALNETFDGDLEDPDARRKRYEKRATLPPISALKGWGEKSVGKLLDAIATRRTEPIPLGNVLAALNIRMVGKTQAEQIADEFKSFEAFWHAIEQPDSDLESSGVFGPIGIEQLRQFAKSEEAKELAKSIVERLTIQESGTGWSEAVTSSAAATSESEAPGPLDGKIVVFSGTFKQTGWTRQQCKSIAAQYGAVKTPASPSRSTNLFVTGAAPGKEKLEKAASLGIPTISEEEFLELIGWQQ